MWLRTLGGVFWRFHKDQWVGFPIVCLQVFGYGEEGISIGHLLKITSVAIISVQVSNCLNKDRAPFFQLLLNDFNSSFREIWILKINAYLCI